MRLLPSERKERVIEAIQRFNEDGRLEICEPCNCGSQIRHNNGGNYHEIVELARDGGQVFVKYDSTSELSEPAEWIVCEDPEAVIRECGDWL